jgi:uncharacterized membrane protein YdbT with pleckstrin-like domain
MFITLPAAVASVFFIPAKFFWAPVLVLAFMAFAAYLSYRTKALAVLDDKLVISSGVFRKKIAIIPNRKVQTVEKRSGPVSRRFGISHGKACVLGPMRYRENYIGYFDNRRFDGVFEKIV